MRRFLPSSLLGQVMVAVALALMIAQIISAILIFRANEERRENLVLSAAAFQLVSGYERRIRASNASRQNRDARPRIPRGLPRTLRYTISDTLPIATARASQERQWEDDLRELLLNEGVDPERVVIVTLRAGEDQWLVRRGRMAERFRDREDWQSRRLLIAAIQREEGGMWETARVPFPRRPAAALGLLLTQTLVTFVVLIAALFLVLRRITQPLAELTQRVGDFSRRPEKAMQLDEQGPGDTRRLIAAHNAMEARIAGLLDEKDVMLGAIGHDLKTPLAALRVRIESVPDEAQREKMAESIEDITATLDDILTLSRVGRDQGDGEAVDLCALALGIVEEFEDLGEPVSMPDSAPSDSRTVAHVQVTWIKRALRNLVSNAVRYGGEAKVSVEQQDGMAVLCVKDNGPGIAPERIEEMMQPFTRGEASRNRATGGAGLGLTLARAIAEQHGGELVLSDREQGGLRAELRLPL